jgi:putative transposase
MVRLLPQRKQLSLSRQNYLGHQFYFVTLCCHEREPVFVDSLTCGWLLDLLFREVKSNRFSLAAYCLMPDHLHILVHGLTPTSDLFHFLKTFKIKSGREYANKSRKILWQRRYFEHVLRPQESVEDVAWYIWLNPVRRGLVSTPDEFAYSGSRTGVKMPKSWKSLSWRPSWK